MDTLIKKTNLKIKDTFLKYSYNEFIKKILNTVRWPELKIKYLFIYCSKITFLFTKHESLFNPTIVSTDFFHFVAANNSRTARCSASSTKWNLLSANISAPNILQLTVHLKSNCLDSSKERRRYPDAFSIRNGRPRRTWSW